MCSMLAEEAISYYVHNNSQVSLVFLDATEAFDKAEYCKLFNLLLDKNFRLVLLLDNY